jgi:hypothetical protein
MASMVVSIRCTCIGGVRTTMRLMSIVNEPVKGEQLRRSVSSGGAPCSQPLVDGAGVRQRGCSHPGAAVAHPKPRILAHSIKVDIGQFGGAGGGAPREGLPKRGSLPGFGGRSSVIPGLQHGALSSEASGEAFPQPRPLCERAKIGAAESQAGVRPAMTWHWAPTPG